jgi:hypothetical protein
VVDSSWWGALLMCEFWAQLEISIFGGLFQDIRWCVTNFFVPNIWQFNIDMYKSISCINSRELDNGWCIFVLWLSKLWRTWKITKVDPMYEPKGVGQWWIWGNEIMDEPKEVEILGNGWTYHCYFLPKFSLLC